VKGIIAKLTVQMAFFVYDHLKEWYREIAIKVEQTLWYMELDTSIYAAQQFGT